MPTTKRKYLDQRRKEQTKTRLLEAGARVFSQQGFHNPRISDIVNVAKVGQGTFYRYFSTKRELFEALFDSLQAKLMVQFQPMTQNLPESIDEYIDSSIQALRRLSNILQEEKDLLLVFLQYGQSVDQDFTDKMRKTFDSFAQLAKFYLDHAMKQGFVKKCDSEIISQALVGIALRFVDKWQQGVLEQGEIDSIIKKTVDFAFYGFAIPRENNNGKTER